MVHECVELAVKSKLVPSDSLDKLPAALKSLAVLRKAGATDAHARSTASDLEDFWSLAHYMLASGKAERIKNILEESNEVGQVYTPDGWTKRIMTEILGASLELASSKKALPTTGSAPRKQGAPDPSFEIQTPTQLFTSMLRRDLSERGGPSSKKTPRRCDGAFKDDDEAERVSEFLDRFPDFDLLKTNVERVFKVAPTYEHTTGLLKAGTGSAYSIHALGKGQLASKLKGDDAFSEADIDAIYRKANDVTLAVSFVAGKLQGLPNALAIPGISAKVGLEKRAEVEQLIPSLRTLFNFGDSCDCASCMSVYGPAAYLVDTLEFLEAREVVRVSNGSRLSAELLIQMARPDVAHLDLSCININVTIPYIDIACEVIEEFISPSYREISWENLELTRENVFAVVWTALDVECGEDAVMTTHGMLGFFEYAIVRHEDAVIKAVAQGFGSQGFSVTPLRQTTGTSAERASLPKCISRGVYDKLAEAAAQPSLPFHLDNAEGRQYFDKLFGVPREELIELLTPVAQLPDTADPVILAEFLCLSSKELSLITQPATDPRPYWIVGDAPDLIATLRNVETFVDNTAVTYAHLLALLRARAWMNPDG
ncbi:hypothetical protein OQA88_13178 [Cercophora sp. LCS_1]